MMIPESIRTRIRRELSAPVEEATPLSGGDINRAARVRAGGIDYFLKWNEAAPGGMFRAEEQGLDLLRAATSLAVPSVFVSHEPDSECPGFLLMEFFQPGTPTDTHREVLGKGLAELHGKTGEQFGLDHDNFIGRLPQRNREHAVWHDFFRDERIDPQLRRAVDGGRLSRSLLSCADRFYAQLPDLFPESPPSLLHGDLWSGNVLFTKSGTPALIDPAVYFGHPEMDLAFTRMFGGFSESFYRAYESVRPIDPGFEERIPIYNLYPLLVHANLFGGGYADRAAQFLSRF
ncbi:MAG: fructosamine kinase family protein [Balneolaceae bacterium]